MGVGSSRVGAKEGNCQPAAFERSAAGTSAVRRLPELCKAHGKLHARPAEFWAQLPCATYKLTSQMSKS